MKLFVGSLPFEAVDQDLQELFGTFGEIRNAKVVMDRETGRSRGFGFVEFTSPDSARKAIADLDGSTYGRRTLAVKEAEDRRPVLGTPRQAPSNGGARSASGPQVTYKGRPTPPPQEFDVKKKKKRGGSRRRRDDDDYSHWSS